MLIKNQKVIIKWNSKNKNYYVSKGYKFTKMKDTFEVNIEDLSKGCNQKVKYLCDNCNNEMYISFKRVNGNTIHYCKKCVTLKRKQTCLQKYGVDNAAKLESIKNKTKETNLQKYGYDNPMKNKNIQNKVKNTNLQKYGVEYSFQSEEVKQKIKDTNLKKYGAEYFSQTNEFNKKIKETSLQKYGVEHPFQSEEVKQKIKDTNLKKYGAENNMKSEKGYQEYKQVIIDKYNVDNISKLKIVQQHIRESLYNNKTAPSSKSQRYICNLLHGQLNYPMDYFSLDIAFPEEMIYIEYDGSGHWMRICRGQITIEKFKQLEVNRKLYLQNKGWKLIRIISKKDKLYNDDKLLNLINEAKDYLLNTIHTWVEIDIDNNEYRCKEYIKGIK